MDILIASLIMLATFITMEGVAWAAHKYLMHGAMWYFHRDHHQHEPGFFEKNDAFFLIFAVPSAWCIITGIPNADFRLWIGAGIAAYGLCYFLVHDVFIHRRFSWFRNAKHPTSPPSARPTRSITSTSARRTGNASACCGCRFATSGKPAKPTRPVP